MKAQCCPQVSLGGGGGGGAFEILRATYYDPIRFFFTKAELAPIICWDQASP